LVAVEVEDIKISLQLEAQAEVPIAELIIKVLLELQTQVAVVAQVQNLVLAQVLSIQVRVDQE
jgi:hypothetical protein